MSLRRNRHFNGTPRRIHRRNFKYGRALRLDVFDKRPSVATLRFGMPLNIEHFDNATPRDFPAKQISNRLRAGMPQLCNVHCFGPSPCDQCSLSGGVPARRVRSGVFFCVDGIKCDDQMVIVDPEGVVAITM